jgi:hypothetical protein
LADASERRCGHRRQRRADTRRWSPMPALMAQLQLDPSRQLLGSQCSGALVLAKLGLLEGRVGMHRPDHPALGRGSRRRRAEPALLRAAATWRRRGAAWPRSTWPRGSSRAWPGRKRPRPRSTMSRRSARKTTTSGARNAEHHAVSGGIGDQRISGPARLQRQAPCKTPRQVAALLPPGSNQPSVGLSAPTPSTRRGSLRSASP